MVTTGLILLAAIAILVWGYRRALPYGTIGLLAWLQSVVLMAPWLLFLAWWPWGFTSTWRGCWCCCWCLPEFTST